MKKNTIKYYRKQYVLTPYWLGSHIKKIFFSRRSWKTFQNLAWGESTWRLKHGFFKNWMSDPKTFQHFCMYNDQGNSVHYDCRPSSLALSMSRITVDLRVDSAEHTDTRATWALSHFNSFYTCAHSFVWY